MSKSCKAGYLLMVLSLAAVAARADSPFEMKQFSATIVMDSMPAMPAMPASAHGAQAGAANMKIYRSGDKMRTDMPGGMGYLVMDLSQRVNYMVMGGGMCMQMNTPARQNPFAQAQNATIERSPAGTETVDGHACKVENLTVTPSGGGQPTKMKVWEAQDLQGFPVKVEVQSSRGPVTVEYKDVNLSAPDASLFVHPENCRQMPGMPGSAPPGSSPH
jgi:hypothetical protein